GDDEVDVPRFADLAARGQRAQAAGDRDTAAELFTRALQCWRGPVAADLGPPLRAHPAAVELSRRRLEVALACADIAIERGRHEQVIAYLRALAGDEALHEGLHARLVLALAGTGQRAAALRLYAEVRARLADELGIEPGGELRAAHLRVLRQEP